MNLGYANSRKVRRLTLSTVRLVGRKEFCAATVERRTKMTTAEKKRRHGHKRARRKSVRRDGGILALMEIANIAGCSEPWPDCPPIIRR